ncbi:MAG TPA: DUF934 domain-containing protein [Aurantimonas coralicida]|uniref:DUF934 domain-containing protein n=1 Tax=Aurantimonas coralicida TaxID=182270 RepID=A0A9C9NEQ1_9HYPH|nr:DUF934 domain-containing protein [Aurantimonas coralicida]HEU00725.1 DUF934 domain-containing protein [Aurantimonas coralicida]
MTLIAATGAKPDAYTRFDTAEAATKAERPVIMPLALADAVRALLPELRFGLSVPNSASIEEIAPHLDAADLIAVEFPAFSDGRGLSLAKRLRRAGFEGTLRASGPLIADQFAEALACGFDEIELPETMANRQPVQQWMAAKDIVTQHYQTGYGERSILQTRLAARRA